MQNTYPRATIASKVSLALLTFCFAMPQAQAGAGWSCVDQLVKTFGAEKGSTATNLIDYHEMSLRALGKKDWERMSPAQKQEFTTSLKALVEKRYYPRWQKIFGKGKVALIDESNTQGDIIVKTKLVLGKKTEAIAWRLSDKNGTAKIVSLSVDDKDLLDKIKHRINSRRKKGNMDIDSLLAWIHKGEGKGVSLEGASLAQSSDSRSAVAAD
ncbi:MAG: ABC transporter substrate-binding protein [Candidatus Obscuribacter sp.]|nr:ABC transporter substrate-binding protein [Candidatus Obscuribacter sp.]